MKGTRIFSVLMIAALLLCGCGREQVPYDPYEGMVQVPSGFDTLMWVKEYEDVPASGFAPEDFDGEDRGRICYTGTGHIASAGIDVSEHQGEVDWAAVAGDGIDFAIIRAGYRGYSQGGLFTDKYFFDNMKGAGENGLEIGVYFFSQATGAAEAVEEAEYLLGLLAEYPAEALGMPVFYDWEAIGTDEARTDGMSGAQITECALAFCETISAAGYEAGIYAYRNLAYYSYDLSGIKDYALWMGALGKYPDFYYRHQIWQYSVNGRVEGIEGDVDLNLCLLPLPAEENQAEENNAE